jgi:hypothetical protein
MVDIRLKLHCKEHGLAKDEALYSIHPLVYQKDNMSDDSARCRKLYDHSTGCRTVCGGYCICGVGLLVSSFHNNWSII